MKSVELHTTPGRDNAAAVREVFKGCTVVDCGVATFEPGCHAHPGEVHRHDHDEVFVILSGEITVPITGGPTGIARAGDWVLVHAGEEHHLTNHAQLPCVAMFLILKRNG